MYCISKTIQFQQYRFTIGADPLVILKFVYLHIHINRWLKKSRSQKNI